MKSLVMIIMVISQVAFAASTDVTCQGDLGSGTSPPVPVSYSVREQMIEDLVVKYPFIFNRETAIVFESVYKKASYSDSPGSEFYFSFARVAREFSSLSLEFRTMIAKKIWENVAITYNLSASQKDDVYIRFSEALGISLADAKGLFKRMSLYAKDPLLNAQVVELIVAGLPTFLKVAPQYLSVFDEQKARSRTDNIFKKMYTETRWRVGVTGAVLAALAYLPLHFGVPWEPTWHGQHYWDLAASDRSYYGIYWIQTAGAAAMYMPLLSLPVLGSVRNIIRKIWTEARLRRQLRKTLPKSIPALANDRDFLPEMDTLEADRETQAMVRNLEYELNDIRVDQLKPDAPEYLASGFARFGEREIGERNLLLSVQLAGIQSLLDRKVFIQSLGQQIRDSIGRGQLSSLNQAAYSRNLHKQISARKDVLLSVRQQLSAIEATLRKTDEGIDRFLDYAKTEKVIELAEKSPGLQRNLSVQVRALQEQRGLSAVLANAISKLDEQSAAEYESLSKAVTGLALVNVQQTISSETSTENWISLANALDSIR